MFDELERHFRRVQRKHGIEGGLGYIPSTRFPFTPTDGNGRPLEQFETDPDEHDG